MKISSVAMGFSVDGERLLREMTIATQGRTANATGQGARNFVTASLRSRAGIARSIAATTSFEVQA